MTAMITLWCRGRGQGPLGWGCLVLLRLMALCGVAPLGPALVSNWGLSVQMAHETMAIHQCYHIDTLSDVQKGNKWTPLKSGAKRDAETHASMTDAWACLDSSTREGSHPEAVPTSTSVHMLIPVLQEVVLTLAPSLKSSFVRACSHKNWSIHLIFKINHELKGR